VSFSSEIPGTTPQEVMDMMMLTQVRPRRPRNRQVVSRKLPHGLSSSGCCTQPPRCPQPQSLC
jgi:hypothetical protein